MRAYYSRSCEEKIKIRFLPVSSTTLRKSIEEFVILGTAPRSAHLSNLITDRVLPTEPPSPLPLSFINFTVQRRSRSRVEIGGENWSRGGVGKYPNVSKRGTTLGRAENLVYQL